MPLFAARMLIIGGCASALFFAGALEVRAQTACCECHPPNDPNTSSCLTVQVSKLNAEDDCVPLPNNVGLANGWTCKKTPLSSTKCKAVSAGGVCKTTPVDAYSMVGEAVAGSTAAPAQSKPAPAILPQLNTKIPGLVLNAGDGESSSLLAQYISGVYRYAVSIVAIVSAIMFIYGAFLYLVSGATSQQIQKGKDIMLDAVVGLILVLSATAILRTINPETIRLNALNISLIVPIDYQFRGDEGLEGTGAAGEPKEAIVQAVIEGSKLAGVDPCIMLAICEHETGLRSIWNGWPNNPKENAIAFGPCQVLATNFHDQSPLAKRLRKEFPDFPEGVAPDPRQMSKTAKLVIGDWFLQNPKAAAFAAADIFRSASYRGNELVGVAAFGAGGGSIQTWRTATACSVKSGVKISGGGDAKAFADSCIPNEVAIVSKITDKRPEKCPESNYECVDLKADKTATLRGHCRNNPNQECKGMKTRDFVQYVIKAYPRMVQKYRCAG